MDDKSHNLIVVCIALLIWIGVHTFFYQIIGLSYTDSMIFLMFVIPACIGALTFLKLNGIPAQRFRWVIAMLPGPAILFMGFMALMSLGELKVIAWAIAIVLGESFAVILGAMMGVVYNSLAPPPPKKTSVIARR